MPYSLLSLMGAHLRKVEIMRIVELCHYGMRAIWEEISQMVMSMYGLVHLSIVMTSDT